MYIGNTPTTQSFVPAIDYFSGNGSTVAFTLSRAVASVAQVQAVIENVPQNPGTAFTINGNTITFTSAPPSGTNNIYIYYTSPNTQVIQPGQGTVGTVQLVDNSVTGAKLENSGVTAGTYGSSSDIPSITVDAKGRVTSASTNSFSSAYVGGRGQVFTGSGTFTIPTGVTAVKITVIGGGGGGASGAGNPCQSCYGGAAGGMAVKWLTGLTAGNTLSVTVGGAGTGGSGGGNGGAGGTSSVSSGSQAITTVSAGGGGGGTRAGAAPSGGAGSNGDINTTGYVTQVSQTASNLGGNSLYRGAGGFTNSSNVGTSPASGAYGAGGGAANPGTTAAGGAGAAGLVIFEW